MNVRLAAVSVSFGVMLLMGGCNSLGVRPWQREVLSRPDMQPGGSKIDDAIDDHVYFSKEASSGGRSFGGGGCGCN
jgi:hypothetical protein